MNSTVAAGGHCECKQGNKTKLYLNRLLIKITVFNFPLCYYCLMTSAGGIVT